MFRFPFHHPGAAQNQQSPECWSLVEPRGARVCPRTRARLKYRAAFPSPAELHVTEMFPCPRDGNFPSPACVVWGSNALIKCFLVGKLCEQCQGNGKAFQIIML